MHPHITQYLNAVAAANGQTVQNGQLAHFNVQPAVSQKLRNAVRLSSGFLSRINFVTKDNIAGETVGIGATLTASRTDTKSGNGTVRRQPKPVHSKTARRYLCRKINFDTMIAYDDADQWAHDPNYIAIINNQIVQSRALSLISMGFNGKEWAANSDFSQNPLLEDCAEGWLHKLRQENPANVMGWESGQVGTAKKEILVGQNQAYTSLDAMVENALNELIAEEFADMPDTVVICNRRTLGDKYFTVINEAGNKASEMNAAQITVSERRLGGLQAIAVPYFPKDTLLITPLSNLSIYFHKHGHRRKLVDEAEYDRIADYQSENIDYIIEEPEACCLLENIKLQDA